MTGVVDPCRLYGGRYCPLESQLNRPCRQNQSTFRPCVVTSGRIDQMEIMRDSFTRKIIFVLALALSFASTALAQTDGGSALKESAKESKTAREGSKPQDVNLDASAAPRRIVTDSTLPVDIPRVEHPPDLEDFLGMKPSGEIQERMAKVEGFTQQIPKDGEPASQRTDVYLCYDDKNLYVVFVAFDSSPDQIRARMTRREDAFADDFVEMTIDTFHDHRRGYVFWSNPLGVQAEGLWTEDTGNPDFSYDTLWYTRGKRTDQGYVVWMAIPFKSLRFSSNSEQTWGIVLLRQIPRVNEWSYWPRVSSRVQGRLSQAANVTGFNKISPGRNIQFIPYAAFNSYRALDTRDPNLPRFIHDPANFDAGLDAKFVLKDKLVVDVAVNPDFSQVESDEPQVTVNQRFEVFFPEKRPFFLENSDFFQTPMNLVFTRRIADPQLGVRLTGKVGPYSIGALLIDDQSPGRRVPDTDPLANKRAGFGIVRLSRDIFKQSNIGVIYTDREFQDSHNRVGGVDGRLKLSDNWVARFQGVTSSTNFLDGSHLAGPAYYADLSKTGRQLNYFGSYTDFSPGFFTQTGFVPRTDIRNTSHTLSYRFRPEGKYLISWGPNIHYDRTWDHSGTRLDWTQSNNMRWEFTGQTYAGFFFVTNRERLRPEDYSILKEDRDFASEVKGIFFDTSYFKQVSFGGEYTRWAGINFVPPEGREPFLGDRSSGNVYLTVRPTTSLLIANTYIFSRLLDRETGANIFNNHILRSKWNYQFNRELALRFIAQYNTVLANPDLTALETTKNFNVDFLVSYQLNAWTALFVGYNSNRQNLDIVNLPGGGAELIRPRDRLINDGRQFFVKFSYLFRF